MENTPTYSSPSQALVAIGCCGQVSSAPGSVTGNAITQIQQITRSAPNVGVTWAPYT